MIGLKRIKFRDIWTPANPGLSMVSWHDAQNSGSIVQADAAGRVSQWTDLSGSNNHWLQATAAKQPTTGVKTIGGFNALGFNGLAYFLAMGSSPFGATVSDAAVFFVLDVGTVNANSNLFSLTGGASRWQSNCPWSDGNIYFDNSGFSGANRLSYAAGFAANTLAIMGFYCSVTDSVKQLYLNGTMVAGNTTALAADVATTPVICANADDTQWDACSIGEMIIINGTVSAYTRTRIEGYLAHKWGMQAYLSASHPCRWAPPTV
jgi:hypothetical protein